MTEILNIFAQFGPSMLIVGALFVCLYFMYKKHEKERSEWLNSINSDRDECQKKFDGMFEKLLEQQERSILAMERQAQALNNNNKLMEILTK